MLLILYMINSILPHKIWYKNKKLRYLHMFTHIDISPLPKIIQKNQANGKRYYITPNGDKYPSVTTVLGAKEKPWLEDWRKMLGTNKATKETKRCADRGTAIHALAEKYLNNEEIRFRDYKPEYVSDFNKLKMKLNKIDNIQAQEVGLYSDRLKIAGTVDCIGEFNGVPSIIDFKTSTNNKTKDMIHDYFKQLTAYSICWHERTGEGIENIVVIMAVERSLMPLVFEEKIENWIPGLLNDIAQFNKNNK